MRPRRTFVDMRLRRSLGPGLAWQIWRAIYVVFFFLRWVVVPSGVFLAFVLGVTLWGKGQGVRGVQLLVGATVFGALAVYASLDWGARVRATYEYWGRFSGTGLWSTFWKSQPVGSPSCDWLGVDLLFGTRRSLRRDDAWTSTRAAALKATAAARGQFPLTAVLLIILVWVLVASARPDFVELRNDAMNIFGAVLTLSLLTGGWAQLRDAPGQRAEFREWMQSHPRGRRAHGLQGSRRRVSGVKPRRR